MSSKSVFNLWIMTLKTALLATLLVGVSLSAAPSQDVLRVREWRAKNEKAILAELIQLIALPNVAANKPDIEKNAALLTTMFEKRGFVVNRWETTGSPIVFARRDAANARGSVMFYFHYDGQPSDAKEWTLGAPYSPAAFNGKSAVDLAAASGPVDPNIRIYGRSTADDKGPIVAFLAAMDGLIAAKANIPWTIKVVLDGEEEAGSRNFDGMMQQRIADIRSDLAIIVDSPRHASGLPTVYYGSRGGASATITVYGALGDLQDALCLLRRHQRRLANLLRGHLRLL